MRTYVSKAVTLSILLSGMLAGHSAHGLPEASMYTNRAAVIREALLSEKPLAEIAKTLSLTGIPALDDLWKSAQTVTSGECSKTKNDCRTISVFGGRTSDRPIVLLPGFTGYRQMYIEQVYDLIQAGFGPVYVSDFSGTGASYKPELKAPYIQQKLGLALANTKSTELFTARVQQIVGAKDSAKIEALLVQLPVGKGYIPDFRTYVTDINLVMAVAILQNPTKKIVMTSLSMSGLNLLQALAEQDKNPTWISRVDSIILQSPMIRASSTDQFGMNGVGGISLNLAAFKSRTDRQGLVAPKKAYPEFADKALGNFNPANGISHSQNRLTLTDSLRVWNGFETAGATWGWGFQELRNQYAKGVFDTDMTLARPLNLYMNSIRDALNRNKVKLITVVSEADKLVDTSATKKFVNQMGQRGLESHLCVFETSKHVIDQESDRYRDPYLMLIIDQLKTPQVRSSYGTAPKHELLRCKTVGK